MGVQRSSDLVVTSGDGSRVVRTVPLAGKGGNPDPYVCRSVLEVWAVDRDVVVSVNRLTWETRAMCDVPTASPTRGPGMPLGGVWVPQDERLLVVPRPGAGEVLALSPELSQVGVAMVGEEPLSAVLLPSGRVIARDWMSGRLLDGEMVSV